MNQVLFMLKTIPEYAALIQALEQGQSAAVTGLLRKGLYGRCFVYLLAGDTYQQELAVIRISRSAVVPESQAVPFVSVHTNASLMKTPKPMRFTARKSSKNVTDIVMKSTMNTVMFSQKLFSADHPILQSRPNRPLFSPYTNK